MQVRARVGNWGSNVRVRVWPKTSRSRPAPTKILKKKELGKLTIMSRVCCAGFKTLSLKNGGSIWNLDEKFRWNNFVCQSHKSSKLGNTYKACGKPSLHFIQNPAQKLLRAFFSQVPLLFSTLLWCHLSLFCGTYFDTWLQWHNYLCFWSFGGHLPDRLLTFTT